MGMRDMNAVNSAGNMEITRSVRTKRSVGSVRSVRSVGNVSRGLGVDKQYDAMYSEIRKMLGFEE
jgi:hypothetical protein